MENLLERESIKRVIKKLEEFDSSLKVEILNSSARTAEDAALSLNCQVGAIVKSLLLRANDNFILCLVSGDKRCSLNKLKNFFNSKDLRMASPNDVKEQTGYTIGGVSPIGHKKSLQILVDRSLNRFKDLYAAAGHPNCIFKINFDDLIKITNGSIEDVIE